ncbi:GPMC system family 4 glycosyltransferase [Geomonas sp. RF6]|uniref:GPMC system family 4 glycosyltransferase n=1 Tax=Geomonas sp. RF6 TaxID=2897342 RepID=UPI001E62F848|nr:GPMC system family 4 glycosyltransferase [Geomonas sp. RF6]
MRIALVAPNYFPPESGNAVTVRRIERSLATLGCEVQVFPTDYLAPEALLRSLQRFGPQLLHAFHGYSGGRVAHALSAETGIPYLITLTGSDIYQALEDQRSLEIHSLLRGAKRLVAFHGSIKQRLAVHMPTLQEHTVVIAQGVAVPPLTAEPSPADEFIFLLPAGVRPVKNLLFPLEPLQEVYEKHPEVRLRIVGPIRDTAYAAEVMDALEAHPFARYLGAVRHDQMAELYRKCHVVLNTSLFEGGMANSVLEALAHGRAVLASDVEGNRSIVKEGVTGLLFRDAEEFVLKAERIMSDHHLRGRLAKNGRAEVEEKYSPEAEGRGYLQLYREIVAECGEGAGTAAYGDAHHL